MHRERNRQNKKEMKGGILPTFVLSNFHPNTRFLFIRLFGGKAAGVASFI